MEGFGKFLIALGVVCWIAFFILVFSFGGTDLADSQFNAFAQLTISGSILFVGGGLVLRK